VVRYRVKREPLKIMVLNLQLHLFENICTIQQPAHSSDMLLEAAELILYNAIVISELCFSVYCFVSIVLFYVLFVCKCVLPPPGVNPIAVKYIIHQFFRV
jgi:hypothetical protein